MKYFSKKRKIQTVFVFLSVLFILNIFQQDIKNFFYFISQPNQKILFHLGQNGANFLAGILNSKELEQKQRNLWNENQALKAQIALLNEINKENETLKQALELNLSEDFQLLLVDICSRDLSNDFIVINKGTNDGISKGMSLITAQKILIGQVQEVYDNFSQVMLITNKKSTFPAKIQENNIQGVLKGKGELEAFLDLIPYEAQIEPGQYIIAAGPDQTFSKEIFVGQIDKIQQSDLKPFQQATIRPSIDFKNLENAFIVLGEKL